MNVSITVTGSVGMLRALLDHLASMSVSATEAVTVAVGPPTLTFPLPVSPVPVQPPAPAAVGAAVAAQLVDANGLPWDARINTSNKAQTKKNVWKRVPGITDEVYGVVVNELRAAKGLPAITVEAETPVVAAGTVPPPPAGTATAAVPPAPGAAVVPSETFPTTFPELLKEIGNRTVCTPPKITLDEITAVCNKYGLATLAAANSAPHLIPFLYADMAAIWNTRG